MFMPSIIREPVNVDFGTTFFHFIHKIVRKFVEFN